MKFDFLKNEKVLSFIGGAAAAVCGKKLLESKKAHDICVCGLAKGLKLYRDARAAALNIKEEAEDICEEAKATIADEECGADIDGEEG